MPNGAYLLFTPHFSSPFFIALFIVTQKTFWCMLT